MVKNQMVCHPLRSVPVDDIGSVAVGRKFEYKGFPAFERLSFTSEQKNIPRFNDLALIRGVGLYDNLGGPDDALAGGVEKLGFAASSPILALGRKASLSTLLCSSIVIYAKSERRFALFINTLFLKQVRIKSPDIILGYLVDRI
jgi:hypothetical protein